MGRVPTSQILQLLQNYFNELQLYGIWGLAVISHHEYRNHDDYQFSMVLNLNPNDACFNLVALTPLATRSPATALAKHYGYHQLGNICYIHDVQHKKQCLECTDRLPAPSKKACIYGSALGYFASSLDVQLRSCVHKSLAYSHFGSRLQESQEHLMYITLQPPQLFMNRARPGKLVLRAETCNKRNSVHCVWRAWRQSVSRYFMGPVVFSLQ
ncbi:hypothetical protein EDB82DRAFT_186530 [Fusarium venenatum]|uniref:uncharacterized protein n=1 Tax=Fusarium venenatum TaxID=56646 RepID=UPI001DC41FFB|nr:hypothetical protein EDB82DRAFT_186530 [Fusarium venenatum]